MAIIGPMPEHTHIERPFQINQFLERSLLNIENKKLFNTIKSSTNLAYIFEDKLMLLSIFLNIQSQAIGKFIYDLYIAVNPRVLIEESSFFKTVRTSIFFNRFKNLNI